MKSRAPWQDGRRAWARLNGWHDEQLNDGPTIDGDAALKALLDVNLVRGILDRAELAAVQTARRDGKSWSVIAAMLGMTRQSAWERWHHVDNLLETAADKSMVSA